MRRPALLAVLLGVAAAVAHRRSRAQRDERQLWTEATTAPDLR